MRVLGLVAALALLNTLPPASAQAPDPSEVVDTACQTVGSIEPQARDLLPICPREEPAAAAPGAEAEAAAPAAPAPAKPEDVQQLADEIVEDASEIPQDPTSAPAKLLSIVATIVQFVKDLLALPGEAARAIGDALASARDAVQGAAATVRDTATGLLDAIAGFFSSPASAPDAIDAPLRAPSKALPGAQGLLDRVTDAVPLTS